jgi:microcystin-dependent protein
MPRNGSGSYTLPQPPFVPNTTISSTAVNSDFSDIATALTQSVSADGQTTITGALQGSSTGSATAPSYAFSGNLNSGIYPAGGGNVGVAVNGANVATFTPGGLTIASSVPIGAVSDFAGSAPPSLWYLCFGQPVSRTTFSALFAVIGTTYGVGDGSTTFNLPDCRGRTSFGDDNMGGTSAGRITVAGGNFDATVLGGVGGGQNQTLTGAQMPVHSHGATVNDPTHTHPFTALQSPGLPLSGGSNVGGVTSSTTGAAATGISVSIGNAGGGAAHPIINPAIIFNKIIFAGA